MLRISVWAACAAGALAACRSIDSEKLGIVRDSAILYYDQGDLVRAEGQARKALEIDPGDLRSLVVLGMTRARQGNAGDLNALNESIAVFQRAEDAGGDDEFQVMLGHGMARSARARVALARAETLSGGAASKPAPSGELTDAVRRLRQSADEDMTRAEELLLGAHRALPDYLSTLEYLQALYSLRGDAPRSLEWGKKVVEQAARARAEKERIVSRQGRSVDAEAAARSEIKRFLEAEANSRSLMALMHHRQGQPKEALAELNRVIEIRPGEVEDHFNRGVCRQGIGDYAGARSDYEVFLRRSTLPIDAPMIRETWDRIADCEKRIGAAADKGTRP